MTTTDLEPKRILVAESSAELLQQTSNAIQSMGYEVVQANSGIAAVKAFHRDAPDLVLLNAQFPDMEGEKALRYIRQDENVRGWVPVIFIAPRPSNEAIALGLDSGADDFIAYPLSKQLLRAKIRAFMRIADATGRLSTTNHELRHLSTSDGLTSLANRRHFDTTLDVEWSRSRRNGTPLSLLLCDVDFFKKYNDTYGHQAGDTCLVEVAKRLKAGAKRPTDVAARYGGEEFAVILPGTPLDSALRVGESIRAAVQAMNMPHWASEYGHVSISMGVSCTSDPNITKVDDMTAFADKALYKAKEEGRNRVITICPGMETTAP